MLSPRFRPTAPLSLLCLAGAALIVSGCSPVGTLIGAGASVGIAAAQERTVGNALDDAVIQTRSLNAGSAITSRCSRPST